MLQVWLSNGGKQLMWVYVKSPLTEVIVSAVNRRPDTAGIWSASGNPYRWLRHETFSYIWFKKITAI
jgi:hypothetical protein